MSDNLWFPEMHQIVPGVCQSRARSAFIGFTAPILNLPKLVWRLLLAPVISGTFIILQVMITFPILGLLGVFGTENITEEYASQRKTAIAFRNWYEETIKREQGGE